MAGYSDGGASETQNALPEQPIHLGQLETLARERNGNLVPTSTEQVTYAKLIIGHALLEPQNTEARDSLLLEARDALGEVCNAMKIADKREARNAWRLVVDAYTALADTHILRGEAGDTLGANHIDLARACYTQADLAAKAGGGVARMQLRLAAALGMMSSAKPGTAASITEEAFEVVLPWTFVWDRKHFGETWKLYRQLSVITGLRPDSARARLENVYTEPVLAPAKPA